MKLLLRQLTGIFIIFLAILSPALAQSQTTRLSLSARLEERSPILKKGVIWYVYEAKLNKDNKYRLIAQYNKAEANITLLVGNYLITAAYGRAYLTQKISIQPDQPQTQIFVINAGGLSVTSSFANTLKVKHDRIKRSLYSGDTDQFGNRTLILKNIKPSKTIILNAGIYHVVSKYGDVNAISKGDITVEAGRITKADFRHNAGHVIFKLVRQAGGEALPDTKWELLSSVGEVIKKSVGALPSLILKSGSYAIRASRDGTTFEKKFTLEDGKFLEIEIVTEAEAATP